MRLQMADITFMGPRSNGITIRDDADMVAEVAEPQPKLDDAMEADLASCRPSWTPSRRAGRRQ